MCVLTFRYSPTKVLKTVKLAKNVLIISVEKDLLYTICEKHSDEKNV